LAPWPHSSWFCSRFGCSSKKRKRPPPLLHALVAMDLPGPGTVFLSQNWKFLAPVYIGDTITAQAEVLSVHPAKPVTQFRVEVTRKSGEVVLEGEAWCYTLSPDSQPHLS
jgi:acyl dehydratase